MWNLKKFKKMRFSSGRKIQAILILSLFLAQTLLPPGWAAAAPSAIPSKKASFDLKLPETFGDVEGGFIPKGTDSTAKKPRIIYIQDAHANPEAQRNIKNILDFFSKQGRVAGVALEGAFGDVNPHRLEVFSEPEANQRMMDHLAGLGELTGAELFGLKMPEAQSVPIEGVDDRGLYLASFKAFQSVKKNLSAAGELENFRRFQEKAENQVLNPELRHFVQERRQWQKNGENAQGYFLLIRELAQKHLQIDLSRAIQQFEWPNLMRFVKASEVEGRINLEKIRVEIEALQKAFGSKPAKSNQRVFVDAGLEQFKSHPRGTAFGAWLGRQALSPKGFSVRQFFEKLYEQSKEDGLSLLNFPAMLDAAGLLILEDEINAQGLMAELRPLEDRLLNALTQKNEEREILLLGQDLRLFEKMLTLTLSREDYQSFKEREAALNWNALRRRYMTAGVLAENSALNRKDEDSTLNSAAQSAIEFYRLSLQRDEKLVANTLGLAEKLAGHTSRKENSDFVVLIAGGFHRSGIQQLLEEKQVAYAVITPRIKTADHQDLYDKVMLGQNASQFLAPLGVSSNLNPQILSQSGTDYVLEGAAAGKRAELMLAEILQQGVPVLLAQHSNEDFIYAAVTQALQRAHDEGLFQAPVMIRRDTGKKGAPSEWSFLIADLQLTARYQWSDQGMRPLSMSHLSTAPASLQVDGMASAHESAKIFGLLGLGPASAGDQAARWMQGLSAPARVRSEVRATRPTEDLNLDPDAAQWLHNLPRNGFYTRALEAMKALDKIKREQSRGLMEPYAESVQGQEAPHQIPLIEALVDEIARDWKLSELPIAYRAAVVLAAFDKAHFGETHAELMKIVKAIGLGNYTTEDRLNAADYGRLMGMAEREHLTTIDQDILLRTAVNRYLIDLPRLERRALEKEKIVHELIKELDRPGSGDIQQIVFLTDLHGGKKIGDLIGMALGLKNYRGIRSVEALERRLADEGINIDDKNILFVGGSDYVDRGRNPYKAFLFVRWLREKGKLKFIPGNHDDWKDWNLFGVHLLVNDALRRIAASGHLSEGSIEEQAKVISPFITTTGKSPEEILKINEARDGLMRRFLKAAREGSVTEAVIDAFANEIIDSGSNPNHSREWWAREWFEHALWADMFLDEMNEVMINKVIEQLNVQISGSPDLKELLMKSLQAENLDPVLKSAAEALLKNLNRGVLFQPIEAALFSDNPEVQAAKTRITELKAANAAIRRENEILGKSGRYDEMKPQHRVPTTFPDTSRSAAEFLEKIQKQVQALNAQLPSDHQLNLTSVELVTPENYRHNATVAETALWDTKNTRLIYVDRLGNAYLHGIIPIAKDSMKFNVHYQGLEGVPAIERMQYDIRRFFEKYNEIPDTPEFRDLMEKEVGEAFRILNDWYSDLTAYLKPPEFIAFLKKGGPSAYSYEASSSYGPRFFDAKAGVMHVGHIDLGKMREKKLPYWVAGMAGGMINGDHDISEEYHGLGGMIIHFMRMPDGQLSGIRRFGYDETAVSLSKELKEKTKDKSTKEKKLSGLDPLNAAHQAEILTLQSNIAQLTPEIEALAARLAAKQAEVQQNGGETIKDITLHELPQEQQELAKPFLDGQDYAYYYGQRFLTELIEDYQTLNKGARDRGLEKRADYYAQQQKLLQETLQYLREKHGAEHPLHPAAARSEVRRADQNSLNPNAPLEVVLVTALLMSFGTIEPVLAQTNADLFRRALGLVLPAETANRDPRIEQMRKIVDNKENRTHPETIQEMPSTVVLVSLGGTAPVVDLEAMQLVAGSRVVILDASGAIPEGWNRYGHVKLPSGVRLQRGTYEGARPDLATLTSVFSEKGPQAKAASKEGRAAAESSRPLLIFSTVPEEVLNAYASALPLKNGLVVRTPESALNNENLRFAFSYLLSRNLLPAQLLKLVPSDIFKVRVQERGLSPAFIPLEAESRFASWGVAFAAQQLLQSAA